MESVTFGCGNVESSVTVKATKIDGSPSLEKVSAKWFIENAKRVVSAKPCTRCLWPADKCDCRANALALAGGSAASEKPAPNPGDVWRWTHPKVGAVDWTLARRENGVWFATSREEPRPVSINLQPNDSSWTFVRSGFVVDDILSRPWSTKRELEALMVALLQTFSPATVQLEITESREEVTVLLWGARQPDLDTMRDVVARLAPGGCSVSTQARATPNANVGAIIIRRGVDGYLPLPQLPTFDLVGLDFVSREIPPIHAMLIETIEAERRRVWSKIAAAFESLSKAMHTERGSRICNEQLIRDTMNLCPPVLDRRGFAACLASDCERHERHDPMTSESWAGLRPADYAENIAEMIRDQCFQVGWKGPNKNPMVGIYERAIATPKRVEGKWTWRRR